MEPIAFPVKPPIWAIAGFKSSRSKVRMHLGEPHYVETDGMRTAGGEEDWWAFTEGSQRIVLQVKVPYEIAIIFADPPNAETALKVFDAIIDKDSLQIYSPEIKN